MEAEDEEAPDASGTPLKVKKTVLVQKPSYIVSHHYTTNREDSERDQEPNPPPKVAATRPEIPPKLNSPSITLGKRRRAFSDIEDLKNPTTALEKPSTAPDDQRMNFLKSLQKNLAANQNAAFQSEKEELRETL